MHWTELERLGLGLSGDVSDAPPGLLSFISGEDRVDYLNVSGQVNQLKRLRHYLEPVRGSIPMVFHALNFNPSGEDFEPNWIVERTRDIVEYLNARWVGQDLGLWLIGNAYQDALLLPPVLDVRSATATACKVKSLASSLGVPFAIENPPFCVVAEEMHLLDYLAMVSRNADCGIVLDIGHLFIYQAATGRELLDMPTASFPFEQVIEVHLAGLDDIRIGSGMRRLVDRHDLPIREECWDFLRAHLRSMTNIKGITLEQENCSAELVRQHVRRAREVMRSET